MVDRIDIGVGPRIEYDDPTDTSGFRYTGQETLSADQYGSQFVDFYSQSLDIPSLSEQTGIDPTAPEVGEDIQLKGMTPDSSDGREDSEANVVADLERALSGGQSSFGDIKFGEDAFAKGDSYASYGEYQKKKGTADRVSLVQGMYEPLVEGNLSGLNFEALGKQAEQKVTGLPGQAATQVQETAGIFTGGYDKFKERASKKAPEAFKGAMSMVGGLPGALLGGALFGGNSRNAFGNMTASGSGAFKVVSDLLHSRQYADVEANRAAAAANRALTDPYERPGPEGFQMVFGNGMGITRRVGTGAYTGNMQGLSFNQVKTMEALQKGFVPSGYNTITETGRTLESEGYNSGRLSTGGYYKDNGTYMTPTGVTAQYGMEKDAKALGDKYGISDLNKVKSILQDARNGKGTVSGLMTKAQADAAKQVADERRADEDRAAQDAIAQRQKEAQDAWNRTNQNKGPSYADDSPGESGQDSGAAGEATGGQGDQSAGSGWGGMAQGGRVGMAAGGPMAAGMAPSGFIGAPPSQVSEAESVADNVNTQKEEGTFIINAAAVEFAGESDVMKMLKDAQKEAVRRGITVDNPERSAKLIDVALSQGEVTVAPHLVKIIGEDRLTKINNRGKPETQERIQENGQQVMGAAEGGFLGFLDSINPFSSNEEEAPPQGFATVPVTPVGPQPVQAGTEYEGDIGDSIPETASQAPPAFVAQLEQHYKKPVTRTQNKKLYNKMSDEQLLAHMIMAETKSSTDPEEAMYAVGQTAIHRRNSNEPEFKKQKSLRDVLLKRLPKGAFEYVGMDVKRNKGLKENFTTNRANYEKGLARATAVAQDLLGGEMESDPAVSPDVMWYTRKDAPNQWMRNNLTLVQTIGEHEFYKAPD